MAGSQLVAGRKKDRDVVWTAGKGGDLERVGGREGNDDLVEKVLWKGKTLRKMTRELDLNVVF